MSAPLSQWLRWALLKRDIDVDKRGTQAKIADAASIPRATISRLLRDDGRPDAETCYALSIYLGQPVLPLLVRAGHLPSEALAVAASRPSGTDDITEDQALDALGVASQHRDAVRTMIRALNAQTGTEG
jgi:transcriptional regulator with XRE-family HTH domain